MTDIPHLAWPLRLAGTAFAVVEQDTIEDVQQCVHALLVTPKGGRPLAPEDGTDDPAFLTGGVDPATLAADLMEQEPRAAITVDALGPDASGVQQITIHVDLAGEGDDATEEEEAE